MFSKWMDERIVPTYNTIVWRSCTDKCYGSEMLTRRDTVRELLINESDFVQDHDLMHCVEAF